MATFPKFIEDILLEYMTMDELTAMYNNDTEAISHFANSNIKVAKFNTAIEILRGIELSMDSEFNQLVEEKAAGYRNSADAEQYLKLLND